MGFWLKLKTKNPKIVVMSPTVETRSFKKKEVVWLQYHLCMDVAEHQILGGTLPYFGTRIRKDLVVEKRCNISRKKSTIANGPSLRGEKPTWIFHNLGNLLRPPELLPASRERVVPTDWKVRAVLGDCISRATVIPAQAPQCRQYAVISVFLDLDNLSIQEEGAVASNWIKEYRQFTGKSNCRRPLRN